MTRRLGIVAALALLALAVVWALGDERAELGAPRALTSAGADATELELCGTTFRLVPAH